MFEDLNDTFNISECVIVIYRVFLMQACVCFTLPGRDEHVQGCVLLYALCPGCIWLANVPDEKAGLWAVPPCQLLPVSTQTYTRTVLIYLVSVSLEPLQYGANFKCVNTCQVVIHWDNTALVGPTHWQKRCQINWVLLSRFAAMGC